MANDIRITAEVDYHIGKRFQELTKKTKLSGKALVELALEHYFEKVDREAEILKNAEKVG